MRSLVLSLALAFTAVTLSAQDWRGELEMVDSDLRSEHYAHARKWSIKLINSMCDRLGTGPDSMYTLATTVAYRAMAEKGLGKDAEADWYWHTALAMYPKLAKKDWKPYGEVGEWLSSHSDDLKPAESNDARPVAIKKIEPKCPLGAIEGGYYQPVTISAIIDADGNARIPRLISSTAAPTLIYAAMEALKQWQFQPASIDGAAVPMKYEVTVNFEPPRQ